MENNLHRMCANISCKMCLAEPCCLNAKEEKEKIMSNEVKRIQEKYGVSFRIGSKVAVGEGVVGSTKGREGIILGVKEGEILVKFGDTDTSEYIHPTKNVLYI